MLYDKVASADFDVFRAPQPHLVFRHGLPDEYLTSSNSCNEGSELGWLENRQSQCVGMLRKYKVAEFDTQ